VNPMRSALATMLFGSSVLFPADDLGRVQDNQWKNLMKADRGRSYAFVTHELRCAEGTIVAVTKQTVTLKRLDGTSVSIARQDLLRFGDQKIGPIGTIYSSRSSWLDVNELPHNSKGGEEIQVVMFDGKKHHGELADVQDNSLTLLHAGHSVQFAKIDISQISRIKFKPMSKNAEYANNELFVFKIFDPELWLYYFNGRVSVLLNDSRMKEDDSAISCKQDF
jgi:hypothetical protein